MTSTPKTSPPGTAMARSPPRIRSSAPPRPSALTAASSSAPTRASAWSENAATTTGRLASSRARSRTAPASGYRGWRPGPRPGRRSPEGLGAGGLVDEGPGVSSLAPRSTGPRGASGARLLVMA